MFEKETLPTKVAEKAWEGNWSGKRVMGLYHVWKDEDHVAVLLPKNNKKKGALDSYHRWIIVFPKPELMDAVENASYGTYGRAQHDRRAVGTMLVEKTFRGLEATEVQAHYKLKQKPEFAAFPVLGKDVHEKVRDWNTTGFKLAVWLAHRRGMPFALDMKYAGEHPGLFVGVKKAAKQMALPKPKTAQGINYEGGVIDEWYSIPVPRGKGRTSRRNP